MGWNDLLPFLKVNHDFYTILPGKFSGRTFISA